mmetsp:Transcript_7249/g.14318  ORF Transcript_7249/g.14318 Transcript_7249/m.14318 type:complete len:116 (-) Transcript_7249:476-823(-)
MASMNFSAGKQFVKPPQRGIFPLDHDAECKTKMKEYLECLKEEKNKHHKCRELSKDYLQCRMDHELMAKENLDEVRLIAWFIWTDYCVKECPQVSLIGMMSLVLSMHPLSFFTWY